MDPLTALIAVVQLIAIFRQEKGARFAASQDEFLAWLAGHRHDEIKDMISANAALSAEVSVLLREDHAKLSAQLDSLNSAVTEILSHTKAFAGLAQIIAPTRLLSEDAAEILVLFANSKQRDLAVTGDGRGVALGNSGKVIQPIDPRFLDDDLACLVTCGFLHPYSHDAFRWYRLTRRGAAFAQLLSSKKED